MTEIHDYFANWGGRNELDPRHDPDDDQPDPPALRGYIVRDMPRGRSTPTPRSRPAKKSASDLRAAILAWRKSNPGRAYQRCVEALEAEGYSLTRRDVADALNQWAPAKADKTPTESPHKKWQSAVRRWLRDNPGKSYRDCADTLNRTKGLSLTRADVADAMKQQQTAKPARPPRAKTRKPRPIVPQPRVELPAPKYCEACEMAITENGFCRCG